MLAMSYRVFLSALEDTGGSLCAWARECASPPLLLSNDVRKLHLPEPQFPFLQNRAIDTMMDCCEYGESGA